jgi:hypothetical protein
MEPTLDERVVKLEQELAVAKRSNQFMMILFLLLIVLGFAVNWKISKAYVQAVHPVVRAQQFLLVDENGKRRAGLTVNQMGAGLFFLDENGKPRAMLGMEDKAAPGLIFGMEDKAGPALLLADENGKPRAWLSVSKDGPGMGLLDANGKTIWSIP